MTNRGPVRLRVGDVVESKINGKYFIWKVFQVKQEGFPQTVWASWPGRGSVKFSWRGGPHAHGTGHGLKFHLVRDDDKPQEA